MTKELAKHFLSLIKPVLFMGLFLAFANLGVGGTGSGGSMGGGPFKIENPEVVLNNLDISTSRDVGVVPLAFAIKSDAYNKISSQITGSNPANEVRITVENPTNSRLTAYKIRDLSKTKIDRWNTIVGILDNGSGYAADQELVLLVNDQDFQNFQNAFKLSTSP